MGQKKNIYNYLSDKELKIWDSAENCNCGTLDCANNHKLCALCRKKIIFGAYQELQPNSKYRWNIDHIIPMSKLNFLTRSNFNDLNNLQLTHTRCNSLKADNYNSSYQNGYGTMKYPEI